MPSDNHKPEASRFVKIIFFLLLITIGFLLARNGMVGLGVVVVLGSLILVLLLTAFFLHMLYPEIAVGNSFKILGFSVFRKILRGNEMIEVKDGRIQNEEMISTFLKRPSLLQIDEKSCVVIINRKKEYQVLTPGMHMLSAFSIFGTFSTTPKNVHFGPESRSSLSPMQSGEGLADYHVRINSVKKTATLTKDGAHVYPRVDAFYAIKVESQVENIFSLINNRFKTGQGISPIYINKNIEATIFQSVMKEWKHLSAARTAEQLRQSIPYELFPSGYSKGGVNCVAYISKIYGEEN